MKTTTYALATALVLFTFAASKVRADDIATVTVSNLTFTATFNNGQLDPNVTQTVNGSFQWDNTTNSYVSSSANFSANGSMGAMPLCGTGPACAFFSGFSGFVAPGVLANPSSTSPDSVSILMGDSQPADADTIQVNITGDVGSFPAGTYTATTFSGFFPPTEPAGTFSTQLQCNAGGGNGACDLIANVNDLSTLSPQITGSVTGAITSSAPVPEPSSLLLLGTGLVGLLGAMRRKRLA